MLDEHEDEQELEEEFDRAQIAYVFNQLYHDSHVRWFAKKDTFRVGGKARTADELAGYAKQWQRGFNVYVQPNPAHFYINGTRSCAADVKAWRFLIIDMDVRPEVGTPEQEDTMHALEGLDTVIKSTLPIEGDTLKLYSGRGGQIWIPLTECELKNSVWTRIHKVNRDLLVDLNMKFNHRDYFIDPSTGDLSRPARLVGTVNQKTGRKARLFFIPDEPLVPNRTLTMNLVDAVASTRLVETETLETTIHADDWREYFPHLTIYARDFILYGVAVGDRHRAAWHAGTKLVELGAPRKAVLAALRQGSLACPESLDDEEIHDVVDQVFREARRD